MTVQERNVQTGCTWLTCSSNLKKINKKIRYQNTESVLVSDGLGEEAPPKSLSFCHQAAEALTRWQQSEKTVTRVI